MIKRKVWATLGLAAALALTGQPAHAEGHSHAGDGHGAGHHKSWAQVLRAPGHGRKQHGRGHAYGHQVRQLEGVVASYDGSSLVVHPWGSPAIAVTVGISTSTVITAAAGAPATLAANERVHVAVLVNPDGSLTAVRVLIQRSEPQATGTPQTGSNGDDNAAEPTETPHHDSNGHHNGHDNGGDNGHDNGGDNAAPMATATPTS